MNTVDFPYMIMCTLEKDSICETKIPGGTVHITIKRRFRLLKNTEKELISKLSELAWKPIEIQTKGLKEFTKSGVEYIEVVQNLEIEELFKDVSKLLKPFAEVRDLHKEIGYDDQHANAHISVTGMDAVSFRGIYGNKHFQIKDFFLVKDISKDYLEILDKL